MLRNSNGSVDISHNPNWPYIPNHLYKILSIGGSGPGKTNVLLNSIKQQQPYLEKIYLYIKYPFELKYQLLIKGREKVKIKEWKRPKAFIDYSQTIDDVYENLKDYNPAKKIKVLIVFDDMIADMEANKKNMSYSHWIVFERKKLNISFVFVSEFCLKVFKTIRINATHFL